MRTVIVILALLVLALFVFAEDKPANNLEVQKLTDAEKLGGPELSGGQVFPVYGAPCTKFHYVVHYRDSQGKAPTYVKMWYNGEWLEMEQEKEGNYNTGVMFTREYVAKSGKSNFYFFEASNGTGKVRTSIMDSPDQGPMIYTDSFNDNQIILLEKNSNKPLLVHETGTDLINTVALSKDGKYFAAVSGKKIYFFSTEQKKLLWTFCTNCAEDPFPGLSSMAGIALSADGKFIAATLGSTLYLFEKTSNTPLWNKEVESSAIGVDMSDSGNYIAVGVANGGAKGDKIFLFDGNGNLLWDYKAEHPNYLQTGNFYKPDITPDGEYIAISTGCPDRRAYLFSKTGNLVFRTDMLTKDSPVHKSAISDDGETIAYSLDHSQGKEVLMLFNKQGTKLWGFSSTKDSTARAVSISSKGDYIAIGTSAGNIYLFSKQNNTPLWSFSSGSSFSQIGDVKLNSDGSYLVAGGVKKKVYLFSKGSNIPVWEFDANTWINSVAFNGEYIVAGTGMGEYAFEGNQASAEEINCKTITEPITLEQIKNGFAPKNSQPQNQTPSNTMELGICGNNLCEEEIGETKANCPKDCIEGTGVCGDGMCEGGKGESHTNCPKDCMANGNPDIGPQNNYPVEGKPDNNLIYNNTPTGEPQVINSEKTNLRKCEGILDVITNFFSVLFGNPVCK